MKLHQHFFKSPNALPFIKLIFLSYIHTNNLPSQLIQIPLQRSSSSYRFQKLSHLTHYLNQALLEQSVLKDCY